MTKTWVWPLGTGPRPSEAHDRRSTAAGLAHSAPRGRSGNLIGRIGSLSGTNEVNGYLLSVGRPFDAVRRLFLMGELRDFARVEHITCN